MNRLATLIDELSYEELLLLKKDFEQGILRKLLDKRLEAFDNPTLVCPVCERPVSENKDIVLVFGPEGFRQKARFCGQDCLKYFLEAREKSTMRRPEKDSDTKKEGEESGAKA